MIKMERVLNLRAIAEIFRAICGISTSSNKKTTQLMYVRVPVNNKLRLK